MSLRFRGLMVLLAVVGAVSPSPAATTHAPLTIHSHPQGFIAHDTVSFDTHVPRAGRTASGTIPVEGPGFAGPIGDGVTFPADVSGAVGFNRIMSAANSEVLVQTRSGSTVFSQALSAWWSGLGAIDVFGPTIAYDPYAARWLFSAAADKASPTSSVLVAVSDTADPMGSWQRYRIVVTPSTLRFTEAPALGFNSAWVTLQANMYDATGVFSQSRVFALNRLSLYSNSILSAQVLNLSGLGKTQAPAITYDMAVGPQYLLQAKTNGTLELFSLVGNVDSPVLTDLGQIASPLPWAFTGPGGPQAGSAETVDLGDATFHRVVYRNGSIWAAHTVFVPASAPTHSVIQWWQLSTAGGVQQIGRVQCTDGTDAHSAAYPSIAVNAENDVLLGFSHFSPTTYVGAAYAYRNGGDPINTMSAHTTYKAGEAPYVRKDINNVNRWGSYSAAVVDPLNDRDLWALQEYAATPLAGLDRWGSWWTRIAPTIGANVSLSTHDIDFGTVFVGNTSAPKSVTVTSTGNLNLVIGSLTLGGPQAPEFSVIADSCSGATLAPADVCQVTMTFSPATQGLRQGTLTIPSNAPSNPDVVNLRGTGVILVIAPKVEFSPTSLDFGNVEVGTTKTLPLHITNIGNAGLVVSSLSISGLNPADFAVPVDGCTGVTVAPNTNCELQVSFTPPVLGLRRGTLRVFSNVQAGVSTVNMFGVGVDLTPPASAITTPDDSLRIGIPLSIFAPYNLIEGTTTDGVSGVSKVLLRFEPTLLPLGGATVEATLDCNGPRTSCTWQALVPLIPGLYTVTVQGTDRSGNLENPGPSIDIIDV